MENLTVIDYGKVRGTFGGKEAVKRLVAWRDEADQAQVSFLDDDQEYTGGQTFVCQVSDWDNPIEDILSHLQLFPSIGTLEVV
jgi:basic membrane lipoprotein Med (substrate-binding protein (PBP1-ABC) superfamily)